MATDQDSNPYTSPTASGDSKVASADTAIVDFGPIIRRWERLRLFYNAILGTGVVLISIIVFPGRSLDPRYWGPIIVAGLVANLLFMTGPAIEGYGTRFRIWHGALTVLLFLAGLVFTGYLAIAFIAALTDTF